MLPSIFNACIPRAEIQAGELSVDLFAAKIRPVVEGTAPLVYRDANTFFANTFPTDGIKTLIREVFGRLTGVGVGSPVIRLETSFGGGKTHDEIALWHICQQGRRIEGLERFADLTLIPEYAVGVAAIDGRDLDPENGVLHSSTGITTYTLWGEIAYQIGGIAGYQLLRGSDSSGISPGTSVLERLTAGKPTVIILDEIARYLRAAEGKLVGQSTLAKQVVAFLFSLMDLAASVNNLILVYSLASASDTFSEETTELNEVIRASARQERVLSPSTDIEIYNIVKQRLFESVSTEAAEAAAKEYLHAYRASRINLPDGCKDAPYANAIASSYPFHPELFSLLTKKIASIPEFQRTRGALRLFAMVVRHLWQNPTEWIPMIHTHHIPVGVEVQVTDELTSRLQRPLMRNPIQADFYNSSGREAYAQVQDQQWVAAGKPAFSTWVARTIFLHSLTQGISSGIRRAELNLSLLTPGLEIGFVDHVLDKLTSVAWYLDHDPITSITRFKEEPSINKIITEEKEQVGKTQAKDDLRSRRDSIFASKAFKLVIPDAPADVDDVADPIALCVIDFNEADVSSSQDSAPYLVEQIFGNTGESGKFRTFRNRLLFLVANKHELERAIDLAREHRAIKNILASPNRLEDISESQQQQLRNKDGEIDLRLRIALTNTYRHLFYPANDPVKAPKGLMHYTLPTQDASTVKGKNNQQDVILKALRDCGKIRAEEEDLAKPFAPAYILQKVWPAGIDHWTTKSLREEFAKNLALNMPIEAEIPKLRTTLRRGLAEGQWDMKVGERIFIKTDGDLTLPETIEFSERMVLYRRGILELPKPKEVELSAQLMPSTQATKPVRVRWKAQGALTVSLYQDGIQVEGEFRPSDEYEGSISKTTIFKVVADYGNGEVEQRETRVILTSSPTASIYDVGGAGRSPGVSEQRGLFDVKPEQFELNGTPNSVFTALSDRCSDYKVQGIQSLELSVDQVMDYRKLGTALPLLGRLPLQIDQRVMIQTGDFTRLEYQGSVRGFQSFFSTINTLLNTPNVQADVNLKLTFEFDTAVTPGGSEINTIKQALFRNPVDRLYLSARVRY
ncbi:MAG TPA: AAA family ATPase [Cyanobacteria bacterium UBA8803]|nr:AAA family ATPase [Cyanobacteria bacterium UBA9273]HBL61822.1 AAA family ATPase [Cyanobacteria bacterium UBA8803]